jgi:UDP-glucose 4-epimerase
MTRRIFVLGASGTIGQATVRALVRCGHEVVCFVRPRSGVRAALGPQEMTRLLPGAQLRLGDVTDPASLARDGFAGEHLDVLVSCLASRTGAPKDAWAIDHQAHVQALDSLDKDAVPRACNLGTGRGFSVAEVIAAAERVTARKIAVVHGARRTGDPAQLLADARLSAQVLGWTAQHSSLENILETAWRWHQRAST